MRIHLWYSTELKVWRWCVTDRRPYLLPDRQESGEAKELDDAMDAIKKIAKKWTGKDEPNAGWFGA